MVPTADDDVSIIVEGTYTVALNTDASVRKLKGEGRPVNDLDSRAAVIGGLVSAQTDTTTTGLPVLKDLPGIGPVFRHTKTTVTNSELIIFITPRTVKDGQEQITDAEKAILHQAEDARMISTLETAPARVEDSRPLSGDVLSPLKN